MLMADTRLLVRTKVLGIGLGLVVAVGLSACASSSKTTKTGSTSPATTPAAAATTTTKPPSSGGVSYSSEPSTPMRRTARPHPLPLVRAPAVLGRVAVEPQSPSRAAARKGPWLGVLAVTSAAAWLGWTGLRSLSTGGDLWRSLAADRAVMVGPALLAVVAAVFLAERRWPAVRRPALARAHVVDAGYLALFAVAVGPLVTLVSAGFAVEVERYAHFLILRRLPVLPRVVVVAVILVGIDAMNWLAHVANHRSASLWRLHALHHSQEDMSVFTTFRTRSSGPRGRTSPP